MTTAAAHHALAQLMADTRRVAHDMQVLIEHAELNGLSSSIVLGWIVTQNTEVERRLVEAVMASDDDDEPIFDVVLNPESN